MSLLSMVLCMSMLIGSTFAWFTDSVTSTNNIIKSGTLDVTLEHKDMNEAEYKDASKGAIFNYDKWEPGYVQVKHVKIANVGTLALKFQLNIIPNMQPEAGKVNLADVIDVYMIENAVTVDRAAIAAATPVGTLSSLMADTDGAAYGFLLADTSKEYTIALKMQESAGNEYQDLSVGEGFSVQLLATQYTEETDSFDNQYDANATYDANQAVPAAIVTYADELVGVSTSNLNWNSSYSMVNQNSGVEFETAYNFKAPVDGDVAAESPYASWLADFAISFNRDVTAADEVGIAGSYGSWGWLGFIANEDLFNDLGVDKLEANEYIDLLASYNDSICIDYEDVCSLVKEFNCAAWAGENADGLTMTVELRLYETYTEEECEELFGYKSVNEKTGNFIVIGTYTHTFN